MAVEAEDRGPPKARPEWEPLAKLGQQTRLHKYKPSARETEALQNCVDDSRWYYLNGALLSGAVMWTFTGMGRKVKIFPRVFMTGVAALIGRDIGGRFAGNSCMKRILSLEGSPLRGELIAILQEDFPNHPLLKANVGRLEGSVPKPEQLPEDYAQEAHAPVSSRDWGFEMENAGTKNRDWAEMLGRGGGYGQERARRIPRIWESSDEQQDVKKEFDGADVLADPFDLVMQTGAVDDLPMNDVGTMEEHHIERRRSRMSAKERREYDRRQYEQRQEQRSY